MCGPSASRLGLLTSLLLVGPALSCSGVVGSEWGAACADGRDNDGDGLIDCADSDCKGSSTCETRRDRGPSPDGSRLDHPPLTPDLRPDQPAISPDLPPSSSYGQPCSSVGQTCLDQKTVCLESPLNAAAGFCSQACTMDSNCPVPAVGTSRCSGNSHQCYVFCEQGTSRCPPGLSCRAYSSLEVYYLCLP